VFDLKDEKLIKKEKSTRKLKHANSILKTFEYFCQIPSKLILTISSYTVSKLGHFFETQRICKCKIVLAIQCLSALLALDNWTDSRTFEFWCTAVTNWTLICQLSSFTVR